MTERECVRERGWCCGWTRSASQYSSRDSQRESEGVRVCGGERERERVRVCERVREGD